jgi:hypothetical protein
MRLEYVKTAVAVIWVAMVALLSSFLLPSNPGLTGWTLIGVVALLPLAFMWHFWAPPSDSMSQSIHEARR